MFRRSPFFVKNMSAGGVFAEENVRSIRPGYGLPPRYLGEILGKTASREVTRGTPLDWSLVTGSLR